MATTFGSVLVANRGEIARRVFRTAREMGMRCVAVYVDADALAPHVREADEAVRLETSYLDGEAIIAAAEAAGAEAIHPGYGFLSENADFARAVIDAGLVWVGPSPDVIAAMGDKLAAKRAAEAAGVPTLPSSDDPSAGDVVGFPLLVKAAAGGGGKGMRVVEAAADLSEAVAAARREALSGFGDDRVFLERYVPRSRHVEIQILGDRHGNVTHLGERECSIQRRHQKIVEESPSPVVDAAMRQAMGEAALSLARAIGYESAGTVEFLVDDATREFFFLEVNTRLQVEHPVTEEVTGADLVEAQLRVAAGESLDDLALDAEPIGHAIEVRLYAEDAAAGFLPATGTLAVFEPNFDLAVRWDSGVETGSVVGLGFDPMLAKVIAYAATRSEAARQLARALRQLHIGGVTTNRDFLVNVLEHEAFLAGDTTTDFIERVAPSPRADLSPHDLERAATAAALWLQAQNRAEATVLPTIPSGWRNARLPAQSVVLRHGEDEVAVRYAARRDGAFVLDDDTVARVHHADDEEIDVEIGNRRSTYAVASSKAHLYLQTPRTTVTFEVVPRFLPPGAAAVAGGTIAPMPGVVLDVRCAVGDRVEPGQTLVLLEAMKMEHPVKAHETGTVTEVRVAPGDQVENGAVLVVIEGDGPDE
jgi:propionyl-CoA carboxylase alpha chain